MPTLRALGAELAEWFDRKPDIGLELVREFQRRGVLPVSGRGNPEGAVEASSCDGILLMLALLSGGGPKAAITEALIWFKLRHVCSVYMRGGGAEIIRSDAKSAGHHLASIVHAYRARIIPTNYLPYTRLNFTVAPNKIGEEFGPRNPHIGMELMSVEQPTQRLDYYALPISEIDAETLDRNPQLSGTKYRDRMVTGFDGLILRDLALRLGHITDSTADRVDLLGTDSEPMQIDLTCAAVLGAPTPEQSDFAKFLNAPGND